ncbi:hypothetical protein BpHYR1_008344 [Brachionus plicatilis]|uniref:Uncharacterized protein n=1 Tax=Brachionus plicatilis TaxID=10195 RepID=A0A3M7SDA2_BRAPC|nr:hypothetical protein BpHYR1_008344 [Brachionus plicatilis]
MLKTQIQIFYSVFNDWCLDSQYVSSWIHIANNKIIFYLIISLIVFFKYLNSKKLYNTIWRSHHYSAEGASRKRSISWFIFLFQDAKKKEDLKKKKIIFLIAFTITVLIHVVSNQTQRKADPNMYPISSS